MTCEPGRISQVKFSIKIILISCPISHHCIFTLLSDYTPKDTVDENPIDEIPDGNVAALTANGIDPAGKYITVFESYT